MEIFDYIMVCTGQLSRDCKIDKTEKSVQFTIENKDYGLEQIKVYLIYLFAREGKIDLNINLTAKNKSAIYTRNLDVINISIIDKDLDHKKLLNKRAMITLGETG